MMKNEKANVSSVGLNELTEGKLQMNNTPNQNKFQFNSRRELLDATKPSRLPERKPFTLPDSSVSNAAAGCLACGGRLDPDDAIQQSVKVCRRCLTQYAVIDSAIDDAAKRKRREMLERFAPEVSR
jgi:hypothetical protein